MQTEYLIDHRGAKVPTKNIRPADVVRHEFACKAVELAIEQRNALAEFKKKQIAEFDSFIDLLRQEYGANLGGKKGNVTLRSFDHKHKVVLQVQESIELGPELLIAKEFITDCLNEWSEGANENLKAVIEQTFATNRQGRVSVQRVLGLRRLNINDESGKWERAMAIIADAIEVVDSRRFIRFYTTEGEREVPVSLDIAKL